MIEKKLTKYISSLNLDSGVCGSTAANVGEGKDSVWEYLLPLLVASYIVHFDYQ